jgi:hypothetical protein
MVPKLYKTVILIVRGICIPIEIESEYGYRRSEINKLEGVAVKFFTPLLSPALIENKKFS